MNTIVLNYQKIDRTRFIINVYTNRYFTKNERVEPVILGNFVNEKFIAHRTKSVKKSSQEEIIFFPDKLRNLENYKFTVSAFNFPPKVTFI